MKPSKPVVDLVTTVQGLLFPSDKEARIASEDPDLFQKVMAEFSNFENEVSHMFEVCIPGRGLAKMLIVSFIIPVRFLRNSFQAPLANEGSFDHSFVTFGLMWEHRIA